jgi:hypothetical protein
LAAGQGTLSDFILQEAVRQKAHPYTNGLPALTEPWQYSTVKNDVFVRLERPDYDKAKSFLTQAFGVGAIATEPSSAAAGVVEYRFNRLGGGIQLSFDDQSTWIVIVRLNETRTANRLLHNPEGTFWKMGDRARDPGFYRP